MERLVRGNGLGRKAAAMAMLLAGLPDSAAFAQTSSGVPSLDETIVTATRRAEPNRQISSTVQVIDEPEIRKSPAKTVTDLLAEKAVGFMSEWAPGQTSLNIRGAATEGQGRDYSSQVMILLNGRRAGTANISKLSLSDVKRIEIVRGPSSVAYGSQAMGGVVNIILRDGRNTTGGMAQAKTGSWGLAQGNVYYGDSNGEFSYYAGMGGGHRDDYETGRGCLECDLSNTSWTRAGGLIALGYDPGPNHRFDLAMRTDGHYKTGFRGSQADTDNFEDRYNQSIDFAYGGSTASRRIKWNNHLYLVHDVDDFKWGTESSGVNLDNSERRIDILGLRNTLDVGLTQSNDLLLGLDLEHTTVRNKRTQISNAGALSLVAPMDNNQLERVGGIFIEDVQRLFDDRLAVRAGARYTYGLTRVEQTPGLATLSENTSDYDYRTYSVGLTYLLTPEIKLRTGYSTGFRAPTGTELSANFTTAIGTPTIGNANLRPESSEQIEVGISAFYPGISADLALFQNVIEDRIRAVVIGPGTRQQFQNNAGEVVIQGIEAYAAIDAGRFLLNRPNWWRVFGRLNYHFGMKDHGTTKDSDRPERVYEYQGAFGTTYGEPNLWEVGVLAIVRGPMWYDTEESFIAGFERSTSHVHRKDPFAVVNLHALYRVPDTGRVMDVPLPRGLELSLHVNNVFDKNEHPIFFALDKSPSVLRANNGGVGNSIPGREYIIALRQPF